jgi:Leucine-rich repeat (LRR) protein
MLFILVFTKKLLTGSIPSELGHLDNLLWLYLNSNELTGTLPTELGLLTTMKDLQLYENQLSGIIPSELGQLSSMTRTVPLLKCIDRFFAH